MIEIKELVVRANISENIGNQEKSTNNTISNNENVSEKHLIETCVRQVLAILERKKER